MKAFALKLASPAATVLGQDRGRTVETPRYLPGPRAQSFRTRRRALCMSEQRAAHALGMLTRDLVDLESGAQVLASDDAWDRAEQVLKEATSRWPVDAMQ